VSVWALLSLVYLLGAAWFLLRGGEHAASWLASIRLCDRCEPHRIKVFASMCVGLVLWPIVVPVIRFSTRAKRAAVKDAQRAVGAIGCCVCGETGRRFDP
jgi:hypothetical protein